MALTDQMNETFESKGIYFESVYMDPLKSKQSHVLVTARVLWRGSSSMADVQKQLYLALKPYAAEFDHVITSTIRPPIQLPDIPKTVNKHRRKRMENRRDRYAKHGDGGVIKFSTPFVWNLQDVL